MRHALTVSQLIERERRAYLETYTKVLATERERGHALVTPEPLLELGAERLLYKLHRPDILYRHREDDSFSTIRVTKGHYSKFDPVPLELDPAITVWLNPLLWDSVEFVMEGRVDSWAPYERWAAEWLDIDDRKPAGDSDFRGLVHDVFVPEQREDTWWSRVDFGSSDTGAFWALLEVFVEMGLDVVNVGSFAKLEVENQVVH